MAVAEEPAVNKAVKWKCKVCGQANVTEFTEVSQLKYQWSRRLWAACYCPIYDADMRFLGWFELLH